MKTRIFSILISGILLISAGCQKSTEPDTFSPDQDIPATQTGPIGSYHYCGQEYPVYTAVYADSDNQIIVRISPLTLDRPMTTYAIIGINAELTGMVIDVEKEWHNDDYYFIYEDPLKYYSQYHALKSGTIMIKKLSVPGHYTVDIDVVLPDDGTFSFNYSGEFTSAY